MKILEQNVKAEKIMQMIGARLETITTQYQYAVANDRKIEAATMAETKWQLAELKMQFVDLLCEQLEK